MQDLDFTDDLQKLIELLKIDSTDYLLTSRSIF